MKKLAIIGMCLTAGLAASAQMSVVKDVERMIKGDNANYASAIEAIKPALINDESKGQAQTWYVAGKTGFDYYDNLYAKKSLGQQVDGKAVVEAILLGYDYMTKALPLDSVPDDKGKIKTKYSKDIIKTIANHYSDFNNAAVMAWESKDYDGAYNSWEAFVNLPKDPRFAKEIKNALPDTAVAEIVYNQGLAAWQGDKIPLALETLEKAKNMGYNKKNLYDYAISLAYQLKDNGKVFDFAKEAYKMYGNEDPKYLQLMINTHIANKEYDLAHKMLNDAIAADPNNAQYYLLLGVLAEEQKDTETAALQYAKAAQVDPNNAQAQFFVGKSLCEKAYALSDGATNLSQAEYNKLFEEQIAPLFREAATHLEKAHELDPDNTSDAVRYLRNVYYNLKDEEKLKWVETL